MISLTPSGEKSADFMEKSKKKINFPFGIKSFSEKKDWASCLRELDADSAPPESAIGALASRTNDLLASWFDPTYLSRGPSSAGNVKHHTGNLVDIFQRMGIDEETAPLCELVDIFADDDFLRNLHHHLRTASARLGIHRPSGRKSWSAQRKKYLDTLKGPVEDLCPALLCSDLADRTKRLQDFQNAHPSHALLLDRTKAAGTSSPFGEYALKQPPSNSNRTRDLRFFVQDVACALHFEAIPPPTPHRRSVTVEPVNLHDPDERQTAENFKRWAIQVVPHFAQAALSTGGDPIEKSTQLLEYIFEALDPPIEAAQTAPLPRDFEEDALAEVVEAAYARVQGKRKPPTHVAPSSLFLFLPTRVLLSRELCIPRTFYGTLNVLFSAPTDPMSDDCLANRLGSPVALTVPQSGEDYTHGTCHAALEALGGPRFWISPSGSSKVEPEYPPLYCAVASARQPAMLSRPALSTSNAAEAYNLLLSIQRKGRPVDPLFFLLARSPIHPLADLEVSFEKARTPKENIINISRTVQRSTVVSTGDLAQTPPHILLLFPFAPPPPLFRLFSLTRVSTASTTTSTSSLLSSPASSPSFAFSCASSNLLIIACPSPISLLSLAILHVLSHVPPKRLHHLLKSRHDANRPLLQPFLIHSVTGSAFSCFRASSASKFDLGLPAHLYLGSPGDLPRCFLPLAFPHHRVHSALDGCATLVGTIGVRAKIPPNLPGLHAYPARCSASLSRAPV
ncbi:hypothetical protein BOTBODRAFT_178747 [Botryobasidium botryosum FD-172 SS1]|uniref:Uncharacterized protein n=1 Tax=Botryobasidium botryosum (strain FD-172 SS1) TaxID=930990 RepID=A0A067MDC1_BOTB1|nr:hypothetical protein BOTBODRAFT_178747 [Botryobasidium botryosum FD-172 SS1]